MKSDSNTLIKKLNSLIHLDVDAIYLYDEAISKIESFLIKRQLSQFKKDHMHHVSCLSREVRKLGGQPAPFKRDFKGLLLQGITSLRSSTGTEGALRAMRMNEVLTNTTYNDALFIDGPEHIMKLIRKNREDEKRHLEYIESCLDQTDWALEERAA